MRRLLAYAAVAALAIGSTTAVLARDPDKLWKIVHDRCALHPDHPTPCTFYDEAHGDALLHSLEGRGQYLLIPTARVPGMESPILLDPATPDYFAEAWDARARVGEAYGRTIPDTDISLAINSKPGRSQNQLHIHIDCIRPDVRQQLLAMVPHIGTKWQPLPQAILGVRYRAIWQPDLKTSPFRVLASSLRDPGTEMRDHTLVAWPATRPDGQAGFVLLDDHAHGLDFASGEIVQDHSCAILKPS
ncbi:CDP-diacylglycerol diphosphatase [Tanticharoenia sakaeratensis]|uniref:CDP-diacylglycerol pyrophosphatase n=1 Tax=Tanticharoenia sakaeratensis NBRC 103193 TaxID=1231623 RepID=A0A0D6MJS0_9PROT|nr:CDP-diacylglycerol diphosphatase [Tanticharoenia sakaeratensis]GAN53862.1 CDP-diacylglycerol pyrophosphatase [Tanticharoenia sakaeratensis NBRC 103193]GBQ25109.1 CDP-diacylglycerol pyrophosphatase [Tanticharoenia sakaeratensis NBRC 103193]